jgi:hypothetical protein
LKKVAVAVEGPSDKIFWDRVLHRSFTGTKFDVRSMKGCTKLIASARALSETFRDVGFDALFLLLDADKAPCVSEIRARLESGLQADLRCPRGQRWCFLAIAFRELESWYLADPLGIAEGLDLDPGIVPTNPAGGKSTLHRFARSQLDLRLGYDERTWAERISRAFSPARARENSPSFDYFWSCLETVLSR